MCLNTCLITGRQALSKSLLPAVCSGMASRLAVLLLTDNYMMSWIFALVKYVNGRAHFWWTPLLWGHAYLCWGVVACCTCVGYRFIVPKVQVELSRFPYRPHWCNLTTAVKVLCFHCECAMNSLFTTDVHQLWNCCESAVIRPFIAG